MISNVHLFISVSRFSSFTTFLKVKLWPTMSRSWKFSIWSLPPKQPSFGYSERRINLPLEFLLQESYNIILSRIYFYYTIVPWPKIYEMYGWAMTIRSWSIFSIISYIFYHSYLGGSPRSPKWRHALNVLQDPPRVKPDMRYKWWRWCKWKFINHLMLSVVVNVCNTLYISCDSRNWPNV